MSVITSFTTAGDDTFQVPAGVNEITFKGWPGGGAGGAGGTVGLGGDGAGGGFVDVVIPVTPLETLDLHIGGKGVKGTFSAVSGGGGGGGGRSSIVRDNIPLAVVGAGGGGGGGDNSSATPGGDGGDGGGDCVDFGNCLDFGGTDEMVSISNTYTNPQDFTFEMWFNTTTLTGGLLFSFTNSQTGTPTSYDRLCYMQNDGAIRFGIYLPSSVHSIVSATSYNDGYWHHVAGNSYPGSGIELFIDGVSQGTNGNNSGENYAGYWRVGGQSTLSNWPSVPTSLWFIGKIDEVRYWSVARTEAQINANRVTELVGDETDLEFYWKFNESSGSNAPDSTSSYNDGTLQNMEDGDWVESIICVGNGDGEGSSLASGGKAGASGGAGGPVADPGSDNSGADGTGPNSINFGNCLNLNGTDESINVGVDSVFQLANSFTVEAWIKPVSVTTTQRIVGTRPSAATSNGFGFGIISSGKIMFTSFGHQDFSSTVSLTADEWVHIAVVFTSGNNTRFYKNGVFSNQLNGSAACGTSGPDVNIGKIGEDDIQFYGGRVDEVRIWNDERTDAEILANFHRSLDGDEANLVGYWKFNESSGTNAPDSTANGNDGTLVNMEDADWVLNDYKIPASTGGGGDGADGWNVEYTKGSEFNDGITNGGAGGIGNLGAGYAGGGGGGAGITGGGGGGGSESDDAGGGGGGGGSNYVDSGLTATTNSQATGQTPPGTGDDDYIANVGVGGDGGATETDGTDGYDGLIVIIYAEPSTSMEVVGRGVSVGVGRGVR